MRGIELQRVVEDHGRLTLELTVGATRQLDAAVLRRWIEVDFLRQVSRPRIGMDEALSLVEVEATCGDFQQCGFARAVAANETDTITGTDRELGSGQQRRAAERQVNIA